jgi:trigger factor
VPFDGGTAEDFPLTLGSGQFIPGFEEQLTGAKAGEQRDVNVTFPQNTAQPIWPGKTPSLLAPSRL